MVREGGRPEDPAFTPDQLEDMRQQGDIGPDDPITMPDWSVLDEEPGIVGRIVGRLFGTDVNDPVKWTRFGTTMAGGLGGGLAASRVPGPPVVKGLAALGGSVTGTVMGAAAPESTLDMLEQHGIIKPGERERIGLSNEQLMTVLENEALLDMATLGGVSIARGIGRGMSSLLTGANRTSRGIAEAATREGIAMLPVQVGEGRFARGFVSVFGRFPWVAYALKQRSERAMGQIATAFEGVPGRLGPLTTFDEVSARIIRDAQATSTAMANDFNGQFTQLLARADANGIVVRPVNTRAVTDDIVRRMERETPRGVTQPLATTAGNRELRTFLNRTTRRLTDIQIGGRQAGQSGTQIADQTVRQMDQLLQTIDETMVRYADRGFSQTTLGRLERLRNAVAADMTRHAVHRGGQPLNQAGQEIVREFRQLDQTLTEQVNFLFQNTSARRMGFQRDVSGRGARLDETAVRGADALADTLLRTGSPEAVREIGRVVTPETMRMLASSYFSRAVDRAMPEVGEGVRRIDVDVFARELGLNAPNSGKAAQTRELLQASGGMSMEQVNSLIEIARRASEAEIPDVSTFLARSAAFQGIRGTIRSIIPFASVGAAGTAADGFATGGTMFIASVLGARGISGVISNPASARAFRRVMDVEARSAVRKAAYIRATGFLIGDMLDKGILSQEEADTAKRAFNEFTIEFDRARKNEQNP